MPWTQNLYTYVGSNPVNYTDPTGHCFWDACVLEGTALVEGLAIAGAWLATTAAGVYIGTKVGQWFSEKTGDSTSDTPEVKTPDYPGDDPTASPGDGYEWRGKGTPESGKGNWYNPETGESLHPDLNHPEPIGPHWDYTDPDGGEWRIYPDGTAGPK